MRAAKTIERTNPATEAVLNPVDDHTNAEMEALTIGDSTDESSDIGPQARGPEDVDEQVQQTIEAGGRRAGQRLHVRASLCCSPHFVRVGMAVDVAVFDLLKEERLRLVDACLVPALSERGRFNPCLNILK